MQQQQQYRTDSDGHMLLPWGNDGYVEASAVKAVIEDLPKNAKTVTPKKAADYLCCSIRSVQYMIEKGELLAIRVGSRGNGHFTHRRIVVKVDREFDPTRTDLLSLEEAKKIRSNIGG